MFKVLLAKDPKDRASLAKVHALYKDFMSEDNELRVCGGKKQENIESIRESQRDDWREDSGEVCVNCSKGFKSMFAFDCWEAFLVFLEIVFVALFIPKFVRFQVGKALSGGRICWCGVMVRLKGARGGEDTFWWWEMSGEIVSITTSMTTSMNNSWVSV